LRSACTSAGVLAQPQLVQRHPRIDDRPRRPLAALLGLAQPRHGPRDQQIGVLVEAERVVQLLEVADQLGQAGRQLGGRVRGVGAVQRLGALEAGAATVPDLHVGIARRHEHDEAIAVGARPQHHRGVGLGEPGQVQHVGLLAETVVRIAVAHALRAASGPRHRAGPDRLHQRLAAGGVDRAGRLGCGTATMAAFYHAGRTRPPAIERLLISSMMRTSRRGGPGQHHRRRGQRARQAGRRASTITGTRSGRRLRGRVRVKPVPPSASVVGGDHDRRPAPSARSRRRVVGRHGRQATTAKPRRR
jgi:hypothetical protein